MKRFMYLSIGLMCLALTLLIGFHLGSRSVQAQAPGQPIVGYSVGEGGSTANRWHYVILADGDTYRMRMLDGLSGTFDSAPVNIGNFWTGATVPVSESTWGSVKDKYKGKD